MGGNDSSDTVAGYLGEMRISNIARTPDDIRQAYEIGRRTHPITIDFVTSPQAAYASGTSVTINNPYGTTALQVLLQLEIRLSLKKMWEGRRRCHRRPSRPSLIPARRMERLFLLRLPPSPQEDFPQMQKVFKWQREYMDLTGSLTTQRDAITRLTLRVTNGSQGANVWLDDFRSNLSYLGSLSPLSYDTATGIGTYTNTGIASTPNRYFQYRAINSSWDTAVSPQLTSVSINYMSNNSPGTPTITAPTNGSYERGYCSGYNTFSDRYTK